MPITTFDTLTQSQFDSAEDTVIAKVRAGYPNLDLRAGTVMREQLIRPGAEIQALDAQRLNEVTANISLVALSEQTSPDPDAVNAILSNFNMTINSGLKSRGTLLVRVDANRTYTLPTQFSFTTVDGLIFIREALTVVRTGANLADGEIELLTTDGVS